MEAELASERQIFCYVTDNGKHKTREICDTAFPHASSSSPVGPVAKATDVLQPSWLIVLTLCPPPVWTFPKFAARYSHIPDARDPSSERWNCVGENWPVILPEIATSMSIQGSFTSR